jgi:hypothetical protein
VLARIADVSLSDRSHGGNGCKLIPIFIAERKNDTNGCPLRFSSVDVRIDLATG